MPKVYEAVAVTRKVYVRSGDGAPNRELEHHVRHSPDGFCWGYLGSGCAELARCILWDFLAREPDAPLYQKFKIDYIAHFRIDQNWTLSSEAVRAWVNLNRILDEDLCH